MKESTNFKEDSRRMYEGPLGVIWDFGPLVTAEDLKTLPCGLYRLPDRMPKMAMYDPLYDMWRVGELQLLARVMAPDRVAEMLKLDLDLAVRPDGGCIVKQWVIGEEDPAYQGMSYLDLKEKGVPFFSQPTGTSRERAEHFTQYAHGRELEPLDT